MPDRFPLLDDTFKHGHSLGDAGLVSLLNVIAARRYACMHIQNGSSVVELPIQGEWVQVGNFSLGLAAGGLSVDIDRQCIVLQRTTIHDVSFGITFSGAVLSDYEVAVFRNEGSARCDPLSARQSIGPGPQALWQGSSRYKLPFKLQTDIGLWVRCTDKPSQTITVVQAALVVEES